MRFPTAQAHSTHRGDLFSSSLARSKSAAVGTRQGGFVAEQPTGTGVDFTYGPPDVFDLEVCVNARVRVHNIRISKVGK